MRKVAVRGLLARRLRLLLTSMAIALGVMLITGSYVFTDTFTRSLDKVFVAANQGIDVSITPHQEFRTQDQAQLPPIDASVADQVREIDGVRAVEGGVFDAGATFIGEDGEPVAALSGAPQFVGSISEVEQFEAFDYVQGRQPGSDNEIAIDKALADNENLEIGDMLGVQARLARQDYRVVGIVQLGGVDSFGGASIALMTLNEAQRITGKQGKFDGISVAAEPGVQPEEL